MWDPDGSQGISRGCNPRLEGKDEGIYGLRYEIVDMVKAPSGHWLLTLLEPRPQARDQVDRRGSAYDDVSREVPRASGLLLEARP